MLTVWDGATQVIWCEPVFIQVGGHREFAVGEFNKCIWGFIRDQDDLQTL